MPNLALPIIPANLAIDHSQGKLIHVFKQLVATYNPPGELPFDTGFGMCSGLVADWLYRKRIGEEELFINRLEFALEATPEIQKSGAVSDFMNEINFFQLDQRLRDGILQDDYAASFDYGLPKNYPRVTPAEFAISFVFNLKSLTELILDTAFDNKMVRFDNGFHTIGLMYSHNKYYLYDPESPFGPRGFEATRIYDVAAEIIKGLAKFCKSLNHVAIYMSIYDIIDKPIVAQYPNAINYCQALMLDPAYKAAVLPNQNILHLNMRYNLYEFQNVLSPDYKPIPWKLSKDTEYEEAIITNDAKKIRYLVKLGADLNHKAPGISSVQPVTRAIFLNRMDMLYLLLQLGANPNVTDENYPPRLNYIIRTDNIEALILLLAAGMELNDVDMKRVIQHFKLTSSQLYALTAHVLLLHAKMFNKPFPVAPIILEKLDNFVLRRTREKELTAEYQRELVVMLETLQQVTAVHSDVTARAKTAQDTIANYIHDKPKAVVFSDAPNATLDFERDVKPLLTLTFN